MISEVEAYFTKGCGRCNRFGTADCPARLWADEPVEALHADPELADAFAALTPGRQRSYVLQVDGATQAATKLARIARARDRIIAGKGAQER